jgi:hypothetical protein
MVSSMKEDVYFITGLSRRGKDFPQFYEILHGVAGETQLIYVQIYVHCWPLVMKEREYQGRKGET